MWCWISLLGEKMTEFNPYEIRIVIDKETDTSCNFGEYTPHDGSILLNLSSMENREAFIVTLIHEVLHRAIDESGEITTEKQDHYIIPQLMS